MNFGLRVLAAWLVCCACVAPRAQAQSIAPWNAREAQARLGSSPAPLVQLPATYPVQEPWLAERRARFSLAFGVGLAAAGSAFLLAHPSMHRSHCTYRHSYGPAMGGIVTGLGLGLVAGSALWLTRRHRKYRPFTHHQLGAEVLLALGGALLGTVATLWPESVDSDGCHPQFRPRI